MLNKIYTNEGFNISKLNEFPLIVWSKTLYKANPKVFGIYTCNMWNSWLYKGAIQSCKEIYKSVI